MDTVQLTTMTAPGRSDIMRINGKTENNIVQFRLAGFAAGPIVIRLDSSLLDPDPTLDSEWFNSAPNNAVVNLTADITDAFKITGWPATKLSLVWISGGDGGTSIEIFHRFNLAGFPN